MHSSNTKNTIVVLGEKGPLGKKTSSAAQYTGPKEWSMSRIVEINKVEAFKERKSTKGSI